ncbi:MAG: Rieske (2Fe-2S) protein [Gammaproteobacteria bacterium]|nr:Rieske (2Fe-2S) protein [Gammaproteobacteria bacterium]
MQKAEQLLLADRLLDYIERQTLQLSDEVYRQPVAEYTDRAQAAREHTVLFRSQPLCVGLSGDLPAPGHYATHDAAGLPLLLTRQEDGEFRAYLNVCRHRGARVAEGAGAGRGFVCPYHAWRYGLDGRLIGRPEDAAFAECDRADHALTPLAAAERAGLLWVQPTPGQPLMFSTHLAALEDELAGYQLAHFQPFGTRTLRRALNWKLALDTFLESYHFCVLHKDSICATFHHNLATFDSYGSHFRLVTPRRTIAELRQLPREDWQVLPHVVVIYVLFPNTVLVWQGAQVELWQIFPDAADPTRSLLQLTLYTPTSTITEKARAHWQRNLDLVLHVVENEDFPVGEGIQRGFAAGAQSHIVFGLNEAALAHFHQSVSAATGS